MAHIVAVTLEYQGKKYRFENTWAEYDWTDEEYEDAMKYWWEEGNGSCDCNRANFIHRYCDPAFPEMECGDLISLVDVTARHTAGE